MDAELRNFLYKLLKNRPVDGYHVAIEIDGVDTSDERKTIADKLVNLGVLEPNWNASGRNKIQGQFNYDRIEEVIKDGILG